MDAELLRAELDEARGREADLQAKLDKLEKDAAEREAGRRAVREAVEKAKAVEAEMRQRREQAKEVR